MGYGTLPVRPHFAFHCIAQNWVLQYTRGHLWIDYPYFGYSLSSAVVEAWTERLGADGGYA